jgi:hypothetical protein
MFVFYSPDMERVVIIFNSILDAVHVFFLCNVLNLFLLMIDIYCFIVKQYLLLVKRQKAVVMEHGREGVPKN